MDIYVSSMEVSIAVTLGEGKKTRIVIEMDHKSSPGSGLQKDLLTTH